MMQFSDFQTSRHLTSHSDSVSGFHRSMVESKDPPSSATTRLSVSGLPQPTFSVFWLESQRPVEVMVEVVHGIDQGSGGYGSTVYILSRRGSSSAWWLTVKRKEWFNAPTKLWSRKEYFSVNASWVRVLGSIRGNADQVFWWPNS